MTRRAAIYARYSSHNQREESIEIQVDKCREYCAANDLSVVGVYSDRAQSGRTANRAEFQRMLKDAKRGLFDAVVIYKVTRIMRNRDEMALARLMLAKCHVEILYAGEDIPTGSTGVLTLGLLEVMAEFESALDSERIIDGIQKNAQRCMANGQTLYGWDIVEGRYRVNETERAILCRMKDSFVGGMTLEATAAALGEVRNRKGKRFTGNAIGKLLKRPQNAGTYKYAGVEVAGGMPALWTVHEQKEIDRRFQEGPAPMKTPTGVTYPLSLKMKDAGCEHCYVGSSGKGRNGKVHYYYRCRDCGRNLRKDDVERAVADEVIGALSDESTRERIARMVVDYEWPSDDEPPMSEIIQGQIDEIDATFENIWRAIEKGIDPPGGKARVDDLKQRRADLVENLAAAKAVEGVALTYERVLFWLETMAADLDPETICSTFVDSVIVDGDDLHVVFLFDEKTNPSDEGFVQDADGGPWGSPYEPNGPGSLYPIRRGFVLMARYPAAPCRRR